MPSDAALVWGQQDVMMTSFNDAGYWIEASADGTTWGNPEAVVTSVRSQLQDGSLGAVTSYDNREATVSLRVRGETYDGLEAGAEALVAETRREGYNTLTYTPPVADAVASVFDVVYSKLDYSLNDLNEKRLERQYTATLDCLPFPRAAEETVATAIPAPPPVTTTTDVDTMASATGWSGTVNGAAGTVTNTGGPPSRNSLASSAMTGLVALKMSKTYSSTNTTSLKYLIVDWGRSPTGSSVVETGLDAFANGVSLMKLAEGASPTAGYTRTWFYVAASSFTTLRFEYTNQMAVPTPLVRGMYLDNIAISDAPPVSGTARQQFRTLPVAGSVRTQGRLSLQHETTALGDALVYVYKDDGSGYVPTGRPNLAGGGTATPDSALYSGSYNNLNTPTYFDYALAALPAGNYEVLTRLQRPTAATVTMALTASTRVNGTDLSTVSRTPSVAIPASYGFCHVDYLDLSTTKLASPAAGTLRLTIEDPTDSNVRLDDIYLLNLDMGTVTIVSCGAGTPASGGPAKRMWLDPAMLTNDGEPAIFIGHAADRSDAFDPGLAIKAWTPPQFEPTSMKVFTACNALDAAVTLAHFRRGLHHIRALAA